MGENEVLEKVEKLTDDQFYALAKEVSGFPFVSASAKAILRDIIKEKEPEAIVETPAGAIIEQEVAAPVIEETPEIIPTVEEKTETPEVEITTAAEEKIEEPVAPIVEETSTGLPSTRFNRWEKVSAKNPAENTLFIYSFVSDQFNG